MSKGDNTTSVNQDPWDVAVPYMEGGFKEAQNLYNNYDPQYYSGQTQAGFSPDQLTSQQGIRAESTDDNAWALANLEIHWRPSGNRGAGV